MYHIVYKITNTVNNKIYIGIHSTNNLEDGYLGSGVCIIRAIKKYGETNFKRDIIHFCNSSQEALDKEAEIVTKEFIEREDTYNLKGGGQGSPIISEETKQKIRESHKNRKQLKVERE
jgi:hypothetical protein